MIRSNLTMALARDRVADLRRSSGTFCPKRALLQPRRGDATESTVTFRLAVAIEDDEMIGRLAALDDSTVPATSILVALVDGQALAALSLTDDKAIADPFHRTAYLVDLLRARAHQLARANRE